MQELVSLSCDSVATLTMVPTLAWCWLQMLVSLQVPLWLVQCLGHLCSQSLVSHAAHLSACWRTLLARSTFSFSLCCKLHTSCFELCNWSSY